MEAKFTFKFRLDGRREFEDGTYPIKVNVHNLATNTNRDYSFTDKYNKLNATKNDFESLWTNRFKYNNFNEVLGETTVHGRKLEIRTALKIAADKFSEIVTRKDIQTCRDVVEAYKSYVDSTPQFVDDVYKGFEEKIKELKDNDQYKTVSVYETTLQAIYQHNSGTGFRYSDVTLEWLRKFEKKRRQGVTVIG